MPSGFSVGRVLELVQKGRESASSAERPLHFQIVVDPKVPRWIAQTVKGAFVPEQGGATVDVSGLVGAVRVAPGVDAALVLAGGSDDLVAAAAGSYLGSGVNVALVAESALDTPDVNATEEARQLLSLVCASEKGALVDALAEWLLNVSPDPVAAAANFAFCRQLEVDRLINRCALENAGVGAVDLIHGADLPIMTGNQIKLAFDIAAAHGKGLSADRAVDAAIMALAGLVFRASARGILGHVPALKFVVRGAIGYGGTVVSGRVVEAKIRVEEGTLQLPGIELPDVPAWAAEALGRVSSLRPGAAAAEAPKPARLASPSAGDGAGYVTYD